MNEELESGFIVIRPWMVELGLSGNELIIFAVINGFSMDGKSSFNGGLSYLCKVTGIARRTAINCLNKLVAMGIVSKSDYFDKDRNTTFSNYSVDYDQCKNCTSEKSALVKNLPEGSENSALVVVKKLHRGSEKIAPIKEKRSKEKVNIEVKRERATRLPPDWQPSPEDIDYIVKKRKDLHIPDVVERFRNYWHAKAGRDATKRDWHATWRNWVLNERQGPHKEDSWASFFARKGQYEIDITPDSIRLG